MQRPTLHQKRSSVINSLVFTCFDDNRFNSSIHSLSFSIFVCSVLSLSFLLLWLTAWLHKNDSQCDPYKISSHTSWLVYPNKYTSAHPFEAEARFRNFSVNSLPARAKRSTTAVYIFWVFVNQKIVTWERYLRNSRHWDRSVWPFPKIFVLYLFLGSFFFLIGFCFDFRFNFCVSFLTSQQKGLRIRANTH